MANEIQELKFQVGEAWKGVYSSSTAYGLANVVQDPTGLSVYRSLKSGNVGHSLSDASWWFCIIDMSSIKAESDRIAALNQAIAQDEALRVAAEELRQQHEAARIAAETQRDEAEQARISAEQARVTAESARATEEQQRITAEQGRVSAESARVQAEQARALSETLRANAEDQRAANEQNRIAAEQQRIERAEQDHDRAESDHAALQVYFDSLGAFDISSYHATDGVLAKYADLAAALGTNGANIPETLRKGGMSVKFIQSSDNNYVQYRLMADEFSTTESDWQGVDNTLVAHSQNLVESGVVAAKVGVRQLITGWDEGKNIYTNQGVGSVCPKTKNVSPNFRCVVLDVTAGDYYVVNGYGGSSPRLWTFLDDDNKIISVAFAETYVSNDELKLLVPQGATQLIINQGYQTWADCYLVQNTTFDEKFDSIDFEKVNAKNSVNLVNPDALSLDVYINSAGHLTNGSGLCVSDFIPVKGSDIISNGRGISNIGIAVYDRNFAFVRYVDSNAYTYQNGDYYIRINFLSSETQKRANYGTTLLDYVPYNPIDGYLTSINQELESHDARIDDLEDAVESLVLLSAYKNTNLTLVQDGAILDSNGNVVTSNYTTGYEVRSLDISNTDFIYITVSGTYAGNGYLVVGGYNSVGTCVKKYLIKGSSTQSLSLKIPKEDDGVVTLKFTVTKLYGSSFSVGVYSIGDVLIEAVKFVEGDKIYNHYIDVLPSATGDASLVGVLKALMADTSDEKPSYQHRYTIRLTAGTYNVDCSEETLNSTRGLYLMPYTTLIGKGRNATKLQFLYEGTDDDVISNLSGLNVVYTCWVKDLMIEVENVRYAVHSDLTEAGFPDTAGSEIEFENVAMVHHGITNGESPTYNAPCAWGGGTNNGQKRTFRNCLFEAASYDAFGNHDRDGCTDEQYFLFENCDFVSHQTATDFSSNFGRATVFLNSWGSGAKIYANFINCRINKWIELYTTSDVDSHYMVKTDNDQLVHIRENTANPQKKKHYSTGSCREFEFAAATDMGTPVIASNTKNAASWDGSGSAKMVTGVLLHDVAADGMGTVMCSGIFPQAQILGATFAAGKLISWNGSAWVEDNNNPVLVALTGSVARIL